MIVYRCEDSLESVFTAIYMAYEERRSHEETLLTLSEEPILFAEDVWVEPCMEKVRKVMRTLRNRFGDSDYYHLCQVLASADEEKVQAVYRTVVAGFAKGCRPNHLMDNLTDAWIHKAFALSREVGREIDHLKGFLRFEELESRILYAEIGPKSNLVTFLMPHFSDRFPMENFVIYDANRRFFGVHPAGRQWYLLQGEGAEEISGFRRSSEEEIYQELFRGFCRTIAIKERINPKLQRNMLPLRFREYMVEF